VTPGVSVDEALRDGVRRLDQAGVWGAAGDARRLMAFALGVAPERLVLVARDALPPEAAGRWEAALAARLKRQPVAQIVGTRLFWGRAFRVTRDTLDPRPETELIVSRALERPYGRVLDLGTGTGCLAVTLLAERAEATGVAVDISPAALAVAGENARALGVAGRLSLVQGDWFGPVEGRFDLIVANPPYLDAEEVAGLQPEVRDWEPTMALTPGPDGMAAVRAIARGAGAHLAPSGRVMIEIGWRQGDAARAAFRAAGFGKAEVLCDLDGRDRAILAETG
jgi:release factor glutamine methyltransferase